MLPVSSPDSRQAHPRALVVGGGIGGLAAAIAVRGAGWDVDVLERCGIGAAPGAGLSLWPNGVRALHELGLGEAVEAAAVRVPEVAIRRADGKVLMRLDADAIERRWGAPLLAIHRGELLEAALERLGATAPQPLAGRARRDAVAPSGHPSAGRRRRGAAVVHRHAEVELVEEGGVRLTDGTVLEADLVIGADGLRSTTRGALLPESEPRDSGLVALRGVVAWRGELDAGEWWATGLLGGLLPLRGSRAYWYMACHAADEAPPVELAARLGGPVADAVAATPPSLVRRHALVDRPPETRITGARLALVGDAAHPMLPFLGQGACAALQDAACLGRALAAEEQLAPALRRYESERGAATARLVRASRSAARIALVRSPRLRAVRDGMMAATPQRIHLRRLGRALELAPVPVEAAT